MMHSVQTLLFRTILSHEIGNVCLILILILICVKRESLIITWRVKDWSTEHVDSTKLTVHMKLKHIMAITKITVSQSKDKY